VATALQATDRANRQPRPVGHCSGVSAAPHHSQASSAPNESSQ
jgi:hypothetical protein